MNKVNVLEINYKNYGRCLRIANDVVEVIATIEYNFTIVKYGYIGGKNHFKERVFDKNIDVCCNESFGGHVLEYTTVSRNLKNLNKSKVNYELIPCGVRFTQDVDIETKTQNIIEVTFESKSSKVYVLHRVYSFNLFDINISLSGVTSMNKEGIEVVPLPKKNDVDFPDRSFVFWSYSSIKDSRVYFGEKYVAMKICENNNQDFRIGFNSDRNYALYYNNGELFVKHFDVNHSSNKLYPNKGCIYESSISKDSIYMRSNSPIYLISCNQYIDHKEVWSLHKDINLDFIDEYIDNCDVESKDY